MVSDRTTLARFLFDESGRHPGASGELNSLIMDVSLACSAIAEQVARRALGEVSGSTRATGGQHEQQRLDLIASALFREAGESGGQLAGMVSAGLGGPHPLRPGHSRGTYLLAFDPLDGWADIDLNVTVGSIFSILRAPNPGVEATSADFLRAGAEQVCAGYAVYGPSTVLVVSVGTGVHAFTLDPELGEFVLTRRAMRIPGAATELAIDTSNRRSWEPPVRRYVDECLTGRGGPRGTDYTVRWAASLAAGVHRLLTRGGVLLLPRETTDPARAGRLRLLSQAAPVAFLVEQAGGRASTGDQRLLDVVPDELHQRVPLMVGAADEIGRLEDLHVDDHAAPHDQPLFGNRGLYRVPR